MEHFAFLFLLQALMKNIDIWVDTRIEISIFPPLNYNILFF